MKKVFIVTVALTAIFFSCKKEASETPENLCPTVLESAVPQAVKDSFAVRYPATLVTTWFNKDNAGFCAFFTTGTVEKLVEYSATGIFIKENVETHNDANDNDSTNTNGGKTTTSCECETHKKD